MPAIFKSVILSFKSQAAIKMISMGVTSDNKEACMEEVSDNPFTNNDWFKNTPKTAQATKRGISFLRIPGFEGFNKYNIQKNKEEPTTRHIFKAGADSFEGTMSFMVM